MSRLTSNDDLYRVLKETAARRGRSIASIIEESLPLRGIRDWSSAQSLAAQTRERAALDVDKAIDLAVEETRAVCAR